MFFKNFFSRSSQLIALRVVPTLVRGMWRVLLCIACNALTVMLTSLAIVSEEIKDAVCTY
ncbi:hypothetical protein BCV72DRAFT_310682 [Rhizopus microsporus var. microsporus]|uniref:Uncharacterized protein n=1 Tax=Rhizopus microsporus var. microsporus TaxID=86635 RepID=A0A1X0QLW2_RHIZD|nr:hypothetical protein BCV72DRAFT_310682 [Rhizopus microsporus var. microsporus]